MTANAEKPYDLICAGMALVDSLIRGFDPHPVSASGYRAVSGTLNVGGEAVNAAIAAAKLGLKTGILCSLGQDDAGDMVRNALKKQGVNILTPPSSAPTPVSTIFIHSDGTRKSITNEAHRFQFHPEKYAALTESRVLMLGSLFRAPFDDPEIIHAVVTKAKAAGQMVIADTKLPNFRKLGLSDIRDSLKLIDWITPNEDEARYFTGKEKPEEMADEFLRLGAPRVIVKLGGRGCCMKTQAETVFLPACPIDAVDATGAGDHFAAGFVSEILQGKTEKEALRFANACGAICTTAVGAGTALQSRDQVLRFMAAHGGEEVYG